MASPKPVPYVTEIVPHWSQFADPKADGNVPFCKQLAQNQCVLGDECRFRHSLTIDDYAMLFKDQQPNMWTISRIDKPRQAVSSPPTTIIVSPPPIVPSSSKPTVKAPSKRPVVEKKQCNFWTLGKCKNGAKCPFAHIGSPPPAEEVSHKSTTICRNLQDYGECRYGAACFYSHDLPSAPEAQEEQQDEGTWGVTTNENGWGPAADDNGWAEDGTAHAAEPANDDWGVAAAGDSGWGFSRDSRRNGGWTGSGNSSNGRTGSRSSSGVCFDYSKGRCRRGDACRFAHDQESNGESGQHSGRDSGWSGMFSMEARTGRGPCYDYQQGRCNRGDRCRFSHEDDPAKSGATTNWSGWGDQPFGSRAHESWGEPESKGHEEDGGWPENEGQSTQPEGADGWIDENEGQFTQPEGAEGWTDENEGPSTQPESVAGDEEENQVDGWEAEPEAEVEKLNESWTEQATEGASAWGDASVTTDDGGTVKIQRPCKSFGQGTCTRGENCRFLHELPEDQVQYHRERDSKARVPVVEPQEQVEETRGDGGEAPQQWGDVAAADEVMDAEEPASETDIEVSSRYFRSENNINLTVCTVRARC